jgi:hypothetical protein
LAGVCKTGFTPEQLATYHRWYVIDATDGSSMHYYVNSSYWNDGNITFKTTVQWYGTCQKQLFCYIAELYILIIDMERDCL